jgi:hypothetical protein
MPTMTEPTNRPHDWPRLVAQLDDAQYDALVLCFNALSAGHISARELDDWVTEANMLAIAADLMAMTGPPPIEKPTREQLVRQIGDYATEIESLSSDLEMMTRQLAALEGDGPALRLVD